MCDPVTPPLRDAPLSEQVDLQTADAAMRQIWDEWWTFYVNHFRGPRIGLSVADQMAFYEIAQPILRRLASAQAVPAPPAGTSESPWQDISTAPTDGTPVWAICMEAQSPAARVSYYAPARGAWLVISPPEKFVVPGPNRWWPTHWRPLDPPSRHQTKGGEA